VGILDTVGAVAAKAVVAFAIIAGLATLSAVGVFPAVGTENVVETLALALSGREMLVVVAGLDDLIAVAASEVQTHFLVSPDLLATFLLSHF
jgi:hypothetical protein